MARIATGYARYRHRLLHLKGHLFERRYHASLIDENEYFQQALRYVHPNPVQAGTCIGILPSCLASWRVILKQSILHSLKNEPGKRRSVLKDR